MVRIRQSSRWANSKGAQCKDDYSQKDSNDLEPYMYSERQSRVSSVESCGNNGRRDDEEKCNRSYQSMRPNNAAISRQLSEPVAHTCRKRSERDRTALECGALPLYRIVSNTDYTAQKGQDPGPGARINPHSHASGSAWL